MNHRATVASVHFSILFLTMGKYFSLRSSLRGPIDVLDLTMRDGAFAFVLIFGEAYSLWLGCDSDWLYAVTSEQYFNLQILFIFASRGTPSRCKCRLSI